MRKILVLCFGLCLACSYVSAQLQPIGFIEKIPTGLYYGGVQNPKMHIYNDTLFVAAPSGVYCKQALSCTDANYSLHSFSGLRVVDFVRTGGNMLAITGGMENEDNRLYLSHDDGKTFEECALPEPLNGMQRYMYEFEQNPLNRNTVMLLSSDGIFKSTDCGETWERVEHVPYVEMPKLFYHPSDTTVMYMCGGAVTGYGLIFRTDDMWTNHTRYDADGFIVHDIIFHPENPDVMFYTGYELGKSEDRGKTWEIKSELWSACKFLFIDESCPDTLYLVRDDFSNNRYEFYMSCDGGETWELAYGVDNGGEDGEGYIADVLQYEGKLLIYSYELGIFMLDLSRLPVVDLSLLLGEYDVEETSLCLYDNSINSYEYVLKLEENYEPGYNLKLSDNYTTIIKANTEDGVHFEFSQYIGDVYTPDIYMSGDGRVEGDSIFMSFFVVNPYIESYNDTTLFECKGKRKTSSVASQPVRENGFDVYFESGGHTLSVAGVTGEDRLSLTLTDMCGRCVLPETRLSGNSVPVPDLPRGVYLYVLSSDGRKVASGKIARR